MFEFVPATDKVQLVGPPNPMYWMSIVQVAPDAMVVAHVPPVRMYTPVWASGTSETTRPNTGITPTLLTVNVCVSPKFA